MEELLKRLGFKSMGAADLYRHEDTNEIISFHKIENETEIVNRILQQGMRIKEKQIRVAIGMD